MCNLSWKPNWKKIDRDIVLLVGIIALIVILGTIVAVREAHPAGPCDESDSWAGTDPDHSFSVGNEWPELQFQKDDKTYMILSDENQDGFYERIEIDRSKVQDISRTWDRHTKILTIELVPLKKGG